MKNKVGGNRLTSLCCCTWAVEVELVAMFMDLLSSKCPIQCRMTFAPILGREIFVPGVKKSLTSSLYYISKELNQRLRLTEASGIPL